MTNHVPIKTPVIRADRLAEPEWVAFNWRSQPPMSKRPIAGVRFAVPKGTWAGEWIVRAHDGVSPDIFFAEQLASYQNSEGASL